MYGVRGGSCSMVMVDTAFPPCFAHCDVGKARVASFRADAVEVSRGKLEPIGHGTVVPNTPER